jgi:Cu/Ag efflux pump CusA
MIDICELSEIIQTALNGKVVSQVLEVQQTFDLIASTAMIMINLPLGLVGGVIAVALTGGIISVASLVGFVTLFGVATRNGLLLVDNYNTKFAEGMLFKEAIVKGSMERLNAILMTALTSALGLAPLVLEGGAGK